MKAVRFGLEEAQAAVDEWGFNCGPGALCAILDMTPAEIRPHLGDFERKRYTNPTLMRQILDGLHVVYQWEVVPVRYLNVWPENSLIRVQWSGPWTGPAVPMQARYRHTHWIGCRYNGSAAVDIFDVNAMCCGGWIPLTEWRDQLVPWLLKECEPRANGRWWQTHIVRVTGRSA